MHGWGWVPTAQSGNADPCTQSLVPAAVPVARKLRPVILPLAARPPVPLFEGALELLMCVLVVSRYVAATPAPHGIFAIKPVTTPAPPAVL